MIPAGTARNNSGPAPIAVKPIKAPIAKGEAVAAILAKESEPSGDASKGTTFAYATYSANAIRSAG